MDVDEVQTQPRKKLPRSGNRRDGQNGDQNEELNDIRANDGGGINRVRGWDPSSRIIRVSRASGGKDRHSKVWTSKGLRDRRVRLSVSTAIQFYDLQDRLGYDQPSKAVEWLIKAASDAIDELPSINTSFPDSTNQLSDEKMASNGGNEQGLDLAEVDLDGQSQNQTLSLSKSACSSNSDTSKNSSGLSLSRLEIRGNNRVKARERARERAAKEKEKERDNILQENSSSFTQLLTGGFSDTHHQNASPVGYFSPVQPVPPRAHQGYNNQIHMGHSLPQAISVPMSIPPFGISSDNHQHQEPLHQISFVPETLLQTAGSGATAGDYSTLNFSISSSSGGTSLSGYNRGTLQSNSSSLFTNNVHRFSSSSSSSSNVDGPNIPFFIGASPFENHIHNHNHHQHHQFMAGPDGRLQLYYGDGNGCSDHKDKGKR